MPNHTPKVGDRSKVENTLRRVIRQNAYAYQTPLYSKWTQKLAVGLWRSHTANF